MTYDRYGRVVAWFDPVTPISEAEHGQMDWR
jgi:hypothetical protein